MSEPSTNAGEESQEQSAGGTLSHGPPGAAPAGGTLSHGPPGSAPAGGTLSHGPPGSVPAGGTLSHGPPGSAPAGGTLSHGAPGSTPQPAPVPLPDEWQVGQTVDGRYEIRGLLGRGGMGAVFRVYHREWGIDLAVKTPLPRLVQDPVALERFRREAETWSDLGLHPNIAQCFYVREVEGLLRIFVEWIAGGTLKDWGRAHEGPAPLDAAVDFALQLLDGLSYAHARGLVHRDVKPANCLLSEDGVLKVTDFGLVKLAEAEDLVGGSSSSGPELTVVDQGMGTPEYAAPEQWASAGEVTPAADLYGLGVILFELCCGRRPFDTPGEREPPLVLINRHRFEQAPQPNSLRRDLPPALSELITRLLEKDPQARPQAEEARGVLAEVYQLLTREPARGAPHVPTRTAASLCNQALSRYDLGQPDVARTLWEEALDVEAGHPESLYDLTLMRWRAGELSDLEALKLMEGARAGAQSAYLRAQLELERGDGAAALTLLETLSTEEQASDRVREAFALARQRRLERKPLELPAEVKQPRWSPRFVASIDEAGEHVEVRERSTGELLHTLGKPPGQKERHLLKTTYSLRNERWINDVLLTAQEHVVAGGYAGKLWLWDAASGEQLAELEGPELPIRGVGASPDGRWLAAGTRTTGAQGDPRMGLHLWNLDTGEHRVLPAAASAKAMLGIVVAPDGSTAFALCDYDRGNGTCYWKAGRALTDLTVGAWASPWLKRVAPAERDWFRVRTGLSPDGRLYLERMGVEVREVDTERVVFSVPRVGALALHSAATDWGNAPVALDRHSIVRLPCFRSTYRAPFTLCLGLGSKQALEREAAFRDALERARADLEAGQLATGVAALEEARAVSGFDRHRELTETLDAYARRVPRRQLRTAWEKLSVTSEGAIYGCRIDPSGRLLATVQPNVTRVWDLRTGAVVGQLPGGQTGTVRFHPDGRLLIAGQFYDPERGTPRGRLAEYESEVRQTTYVCLSTDGELAVGGPLRCLWHVPSGRLLSKLPKPLHLQGSRATGFEPSFVPDEPLYLGDHLREFRHRALWDLVSGEDVLTFEVGLSQVSIDPLGRWVGGLAYENYTPAGGGDGVRQVVGLWDLSTGARLGGLDEVRGVRAARMFPDGRHLAVLTQGEALVASLPELTPVLRVSLPKHFTSLEVSADGTQLVTGSKLGRWTVWHLDWEPETSQAVDWVRAEPFLRRFLRRQQPRQNALAAGPFGPQRQAFFARKTVPSWTPQDQERLAEELGWLGCGRPSPSELAKRLAPLKAEVAKGPARRRRFRPVAGSGRQAAKPRRSTPQGPARSAAPPAAPPQAPAGTELLATLLQEAKDEVGHDTRGGLYAMGVVGVCAASCAAGWFVRGAGLAALVCLVATTVYCLVFYVPQTKSLDEQLLLKLLPRLRRQGKGHVSPEALAAWIESLPQGGALRTELERMHEQLGRDLRR